MGILKRIGAVIGILAECFILLMPVALLSETISTFNEKIADAYNSSYQEAYDPIYNIRYQEGYDKQYTVGYDEQYNATYTEQYNAAYDEYYNPGAYAEGYENGLEIGRNQGLATRVTLHNPTYGELKEFLARDKTSSKSHIEGEYVCFDFSAEVNNNAELEGIRTAFVSIRFPKEPGHAIVAFETIDKSLVFIEPQSDTIVNLVIGKRYYRCIEPKPGYYYKKPPYDDTIVEIQIIW